MYYGFHPNYKHTKSVITNENKQIILDYDKYIKQDINKIQNHFKKNGYDEESMILINSWNVRMHIEPSEQRNTI